MSIEASRAIRAMWSKASRGEPIDVHFIRPAIATFLACARIARTELQVQIDQDRQEYAERSGLNFALVRDYEAMVRPRGGKEGLTWSRLTTLFQDSEIESCNQTINDLLFAQLSEGQLSRHGLDALARVVGELHDNVASHADGRGFSAAQFYPAHYGHPERLEISVADGGRGFLRNVRRVAPLVSTHRDAIRWCMEKGNTAARPQEDLSGWTDPYSEGGSGQRDHHMGWGLWLLQELVRSTGGELWIWSGDCSLFIRHDGQELVDVTEQPWPGVLISLTFFPSRDSALREGLTSPRLQSLAEDLGL